MVPMFKATPENYKCCINRLVDYSTEGYNFNDLIKTFFMVADVRLVSPDPNPEKMADGEVPIFDMKGLTVWHLLKITFSTMKLYFKYAQEAHPVRVQQIHVCNCTPLISRVMSLIKPLLKPEVAERFQFHTPDSETIFEFIPREMLPEEYGGKAGPISVMKEFWLKKFYENRWTLLLWWFSSKPDFLVFSVSRRDYIKNDANWIVSGREEDHNNNSEQQIKWINTSWCFWSG